MTTCLHSFAECEEEPTYSGAGSQRVFGSRGLLRGAVLQSCSGWRDKRQGTAGRLPPPLSISLPHSSSCQQLEFIIMTLPQQIWSDNLHTQLPMSSNFSVLQALNDLKCFTHLPAMPVLWVDMIFKEPCTLLAQQETSLSTESSGRSGQVRISCG